jgi:hypothetical protein
MKFDATSFIIGICIGVNVIMFLVREVPMNTYSWLAAEKAGHAETYIDEKGNLVHRWKEVKK